jgi:formamidopyrimidine-DNA glycosylase
VTNLPEVEVIRKDLEREIVGKRVKGVTVKTASLVGRHRNRPEFYKRLEGRKITGVGRRGIHLLLSLDDGHVLVLRPGSQATLRKETATAEPDKDTQFVAVFTTGGSIHYSDVEKDGELYVTGAEELEASTELRREGIDPLADQFTWHSISRELADRRQPLKTLLTDESFVIGLGDLYADEILWSAGLAGKRPSDSLSAQEVRRLYRAMFEVLYEAVKQGGTGELDEEHDEDEEYGDFGDYINVYGREGLPCARCRQPVVRELLPGDVEHYWCPQCQT